MLLVGLFLLLIGLHSSSCTQIGLFNGPLFNGVTSFTITAETSTVIKQTPCFITSSSVSQCRRKRGIEEQPRIIQGDNWQIAPSTVIGVETTNAPRLPRSSFNGIFSSFDDSFSSALNIFRQLEARGKNNVITVGNCGMSTVNFSQFLSCLGMTVQETTTLTATFTETKTLSTGYTTMTVLGCTPAGFPYVCCPETEEEIIWENTHNSTTEEPFPNYPQYFFKK